MGTQQQGTGRVSSAQLDGTGTSPFTMYGGADTGGAAGTLASSSIMRRLQISSSRVAEVFFSEDNVNALQHGVRYGVFRASHGHHVIGPQSEVELALVMRSVYLEHGRNLDDQALVLKEVRSLNKIVLDYCVPRVLAEVNMYVRYRRDVSSLPVPMARGELATSRGDRQLVMSGF